MAKVKMPLFSIEARGQLGKVLVYRKNGIVSRYFIPRDPKSAAQLAQREAFLEFVMSGLTKEEADLLYATIAHTHSRETILGTHGAADLVPGSDSKILGIFAYGFQTLLATISLPYDGVLKNLYVRASGTQPGDGSLEVRLRSGGSYTDVALEIAAGETTGLFSNLTDEYEYPAGETFRIDLINNSASNSISIGVVNLEYSW